jgi:TonB family protein
MIALYAEAALRSLALGVVVWVAMAVFRPRNPHVHKVVWTTVLLASIAMPFMLVSPIAPTFDVPGYWVELTWPVTAAPAAAQQDPTWLAWADSLSLARLSGIYFLVTFVLLARFAFGLLQVWLIRRSATPLAADPAIRMSTKVTSPATFGSTILLPASATEWDEAKQSAVLAHERAHVRHKDCYVLWLAHLHACVFWFNPLAWWLHRRLAELAETTSDDAVLQAIADRTTYAELLLEIARQPSTGRVVMSAARPNISSRIERIISNVTPSLPPRRWVRALAVAALIPPFALAAATLQAPEQPAAPQVGAVGEDPMKPKIIDFGDLAQLQRYYPPEAKRLGIEGIVVVSITLDREGQIAGTQVIEAYPDDPVYGLGPAAEAVVRTMRWSNPKKMPTQVNLRVKFDLAN